jgi:hypothetical protein
MLWEFLDYAVFNKEERLRSNFLNDVHGKLDLALNLTSKVTPRKENQLVLGSLDERLLNISPESNIQYCKESEDDKFYYITYLTSIEELVKKIEDLLRIPVDKKIKDRTLYSGVLVIPKLNKHSVIECINKMKEQGFNFTYELGDVVYLQISNRSNIK